MNRKFMAVVLVAVLCCNLCYPRRASAMAFAAPEVLMVMAAGLTSVGIYYESTNNPNFNAAMTVAYEAMSAEGQSAVQSWVNAGENGVATINWTIDTIRDFCTARDALVDNTGTYEFDNPNSGGGGGSFPSGVSSLGDQVGIFNVTLAITGDNVNSYRAWININNGNQWTLSSTYWDVGGSQYHKKIELSASGVSPILLLEQAGVPMGGDYGWVGYVDCKYHGFADPVSLTFEIPPDGNGITVKNGLGATIATAAGSGLSFASIDNIGYNAAGQVLSGGIAQAATVEQTLNPATDYTTDRKVAFPPSSLTGLDGTIQPVDTATGAIGNPTIAPPLTDVTTPWGDVTGWLSELWRATTTGLNGVISSLSGVIFGIDALTGTITAAITDFFDLTIPVNFEPLKLTGIGFTTLFPFSLPWDVARIITAFESSEWDGEVTYNPSVPIFGSMDASFDLSAFDGIRGICKTFELIIFNIGLILATRRLMGGDV